MQNCALTTLQLLLTTLTAALATPQPPTSGCGIDRSTVAGKPSFNSTISSSGGIRSFLIHIPTGYDSDTPTGLVLSYHGNSRTVTYQESLSQFSNETFNPDWIAVYPQGINNSWQGPTYAVPGVSDLEFTDDLLAYMRQNYCVDDSRIYATGKSNGGGFVGTLACDAAVGGNFAAFAPVSGAFYTDVNASSPCSPARRPLPVLEFHGFEDTTIPYAGGKGAGGLLPSIPAWLQRWAGRDGCVEPNRTTVEYGGVVRHSSWACAGVEGVVQGYNVSGLAHVWPSTEPNADNKGNVTVVDATEVIMEFFRRWRKEGEGWNRWER